VVNGSASSNTLRVEWGLAASQLDFTWPIGFQALPHGVSLTRFDGLTGVLSGGLISTID
jgi:hypothetical protein